MKLPGAPVLPMGSFAQNGFVGSGERPGNFNTGASAAQPGVVQREPLDREEPPTVQRSILSSLGSGNDGNSSSDSGGDETEKMPKIVSAQQLDVLADKLVPRIKRLMRAEMERGVFR